MGSSSKRRQTMAKMTRERALQEKRERKQQKKDEKKEAAARAAEGEVLSETDEDESAPTPPG
jgi:ribosome assembly protein YihI (activator of Der GTPase)